MSHHSGFTIFFRPGHPPIFSLCVGNTKSNPLTLKLFEEFGSDGPANKVWNRLFPDMGLACADLRVIMIIRPLTVSRIDPYMMEFRDCEIISESKPDPEYTGALPIVSIVSVRYAEKIMKDLPEGARKVP